MLTAVALSLLAGGCRVDTTVEARVGRSGGTVSVQFRLDREAVAVLGTSVGEGAQTSDLAQAGWKIAPVHPTEDGGAEVELTKAFHRPQDLAVVIGELAGPAGPLRGFRLDRHRSFLETTYRLQGTADPGAVTGFANAPDLAARLRDAGVDPAQVQALLAGRAADGLHLKLVVALPGRTESFAVEPGSPQGVDVSSSSADRTRPALLVVALVTGLAAARRRRRRPEPGSFTGPSTSTQT